MALSASTVFEINSLATASNTNGGGFNPANAGMLTNLTTDANTANTAAPVVSSASYNFVAGDVGNWLYIQSGTNWTPGWYKIISVATNKATLEASVGSTNVRQVSNNTFGANTVIGCATVGTPTGGVFTIDYSQSLSCIASTAVSDYASALSSTTMTSATAAFTPVMVGNIFHLNNAGTGGFGVVGWYEIATYVNATTITTDRTTNSGTAMVAGQGRIGGALSLGSSDDAVFELTVSSTTAATRFFVKGGSNITYTIGGTVSIAATGNASWPARIESYAVNRGDAPKDTQRPTIQCGANQFTNGTNIDCHGLIIISSAAIGFGSGSSSKCIDCKFINPSTTANRSAVSPGTNGYFLRCEFICYRGRGVTDGSASADFFDCTFHDSDIGVFATTSSAHFTRCLFFSNVTAGFSGTTALSGVGIFEMCTFYGAENKLGIGLNLITGTTNVKVRNSIIYGFTTGLSHADVNTVGLGGYNCWFNNTNNVNAVANWQIGGTSINADPKFANVKQISGTTATTTAGQHLVQAGANFITNGVVAGVNFVYLKSGTGTTAGIYSITSIDSETQITLDQDPTANATADKAWQITTGLNFTPTNSLTIESPTTAPGTATLGYGTMGSSQRKAGATAYIRRR